MSDMMYPYLKDTSTKDLIAFLAMYIKTPPIDESDRQFIREIQDQLKTRKDIGDEK